MPASLPPCARAVPASALLAATLLAGCQGGAPSAGARPPAPPSRTPTSAASPPAPTSSSSPQPTSPGPSPSASRSPSPTPSPRHGTADDPLLPAAARPDTGAETAVARFLGATRQGRWRAAYSLLDSETQQRLGGYDGFFGSRSEYSEGLAAFADAPDLRLTTLPLGDGDSVVTVTGRVTREGMTEDAAFAFPVKSTTTDSRVVLHSTTTPRSSVQAPYPRVAQPVLHGGDPLVASVPQHARYVLAVDDVAVEGVREQGADDGRLMLSAVPAIRGSGLHVVTLAVRDTAGRLQGLALRFRVR